MRSVPVSSRSNYATRAALAALVSAAGLAGTASAQTTFVKADNTNSLNLAGSYVGSSGVPGTLDTILVDNTLSATRTSALGGNLSIAALSMTAAPVSGASRQLQINATTGATLTIGSGGITKAANTSPLIINSALALSANQTWNLAAVTGGGTGNLQINGTFSDGGNTLAINGAGVLDLRPTSTLTFGSNVTIDTTVSVNGASADVVLGGNNTFNRLDVPNGKVSGSVIGNFGEASNFGDGGTNTTILLGNTTNGTLVYTGLSDTTNRTFTRDARSTASSIEVSTAGETLTISGAIATNTQVNVGSSGWVFGGAGNLTLNGAIGNAANGTGTTVTKNGNGTLTLGGNNAFAGDLTINSGTLALGANERIVNTVNVTLASATFNAASFTETLGTLTLSGTGLISLDTGASLVFADSSATSWSGSLSVSGAFVNNSSIRFGTSASGITSTQLAAITINSQPALIDTDGYLYVIPEPSTWAAIAGAGALGLALLRRRRS